MSDGAGRSVTVSNWGVAQTSRHRSIQGQTRQEVLTIPTPYSWPIFLTHSIQQSLNRKRQSLQHIMGSRTLHKHLINSNADNADHALVITCPPSLDTLLLYEYIKFNCRSNGQQSEYLQFTLHGLITVNDPI